MRVKQEQKSNRLVTIIDYKTKSYENFDVKKGRFADGSLLGFAGDQSSGPGSEQCDTVDKK